MTRNSTIAIHRDPESGLLCTLAAGEAVIVGCTDPAAISLDIPPVIEAEGRAYRVTAIGESAFAYMSNLQRVTLPPSLRRIAHGAFEATGLTEVHLPGGLESLAPHAFHGCGHLIRLTLPASDAFALEECVFSGCSALQADGVAHGEYYPEAALRRSGLAAPVQQRIVYVDGAAAQPADAHTPAQKMLEDGIAHEDGGRYTEAAAAYMQAHAFRDSLARIAAQDQRLATLHAVSEAEYRLALLLKFGLAPVKNPDGSQRPGAAQLLQLVIDTTASTDAAYHLGDMYAGGYDVPRDPVRAIELLRKAANAGHERACLDLGYSCLYGTLEPARPDAALRFFSKCAEMNGPYAFIAQEEMASMQRTAAQNQHC